MRKTTMIAAAVAVVLLTGAPAKLATALPLAAASKLGAAFGHAGLVLGAAGGCGFADCVAARPRHRWRWGRRWRWSDDDFPPACVYRYHYDCRPDPFGRLQCACWPNY